MTRALHLAELANRKAKNFFRLFSKNVLTFQKTCDIILHIIEYFRATHSELPPAGPNADGTLETPVFTGAEGASVLHVNLSGKRTKVISLVILFCFDGWRVPSVFYFVIIKKYINRRKTWKHS